MPKGAGAAPAGSSPAGYGAFDLGTPAGKVILPDPKTNISLQGRYLDPFKKDYVFTADGRIQGFSMVQGLVQLALSTQLGSSAIAALGQSFTTIQEQQPNFQRQISTSVENALADLIRRGLVQLVDVQVQTLPSNPDAGLAFVLWRDLTTGALVQTPLNRNTPVGAGNVVLNPT